LKVAKTLTTGQRIRAARKANKMKQRQLAEAIGVARETVAQWERGFRQPEKRSLVALSAVLGVKI
jgi:transcriptional regulator with XRE-family HTH domain